MKSWHMPVYNKIIMSFEGPKLESKERIEKPREMREFRDGELVSTTKFSYDKAGHLLKEERASGGRSKNKQVSEYEYDEMGRMVRRTMRFDLSRPQREDSGARHEVETIFERNYERDALGPSLESFLRDGKTRSMTESIYNEAGRLVRRVETFFRDLGETPTEYTETFIYDEEGRVAERVRQGGNQKPYYFKNTYDKQGRLIREERGYEGEKPHGLVTTSYSEDGRTVTQLNTFGRPKKEKVWRQVETRDEHGNVTEFTHTAFEDDKIKRTNKTRYEYSY